jgi:hypothetical protein
MAGDTFIDVRLEDGSVYRLDVTPPSPSTGGDAQTIRFPVGTSSSSSTTAIPVGATVLSALLDVSTPYSPGTTMTVGCAAQSDLLMRAADSDPSTGDLFAAPQDTQWTSGQAVLVTVAGAPAVGAATCIVVYAAAPQP